MKVLIKVKFIDDAVNALKQVETNVFVGIPHPYGYCVIRSDDKSGLMQEVLKPFAWSKTMQGEINYVE